MRKGARIILAAGEGTDSNDPTSILMRQIIDPFAEYERAVIEAQYESRPEGVRARGERAGAIPFGYGVAADGVKLEAAAEEQCIIAAVSGLRAAGYTLRAISQELNGRGFTTRLGRHRADRAKGGF